MSRKAKRSASPNSSSVRSVRARRRLVTIIVVMVVLAVAVAANRGPVTDYLHARARAEQKAQVVQQMEEQLAAYEEHVKRLDSDDSIEVIARQELVYARAGEDVFIVTGGPDEALPGAGPVSERGDAGDRPRLAISEEADTDSSWEKGPIERFVEAVFGLFR